MLLLAAGFLVANKMLPGEVADELLQYKIG
jgi:hypothetical protein